MAYRVGIDIGGTFTDFALLKGPDIVLHKTLSTAADRSVGVMTGLETLAEIEGLPLGDFLGRCEAIVHGTTIADNTLIEMNGATTGLITTEGFRDEIEYRRGYKESIWDVRLEPPKEIAPRRRRLTVPERVLADGSIHRPLDEDAVREACARLKKQDVQSVAISLLFSFVNPVHENRIAEIVAEELPGVEISLSHEVLPRAPEYDRTSTTVVNAYVAPRVTSYLNRLAERLGAAGYRNRLMVMQASGGVMTKDYIERSPVRVLASGPAGGVIGSAHFGLKKGHPNLLCVDMGGTSYDVSLVLDGKAPAVSGWNMHHRYLVGLPMVQVETLGAGGGSICTVRDGEVRVGPASAGSSPGPICYGRGGTQPTVTDALMILGILSPASAFAGGGLSLRPEGVREAFEEMGQAMGYGAEDAAFDCWRVVNANMSQAVRRTTAGKGVDPRGLVMLAYGGNGPAFAAIQADDLGITKVLAPKASPAFSALGALAAKPTIDEERSCACPAEAPDLARLGALWRELDERAEACFAAAGFVRAALATRYQVNMRYRGQNWALAFDVHASHGACDLSFLDEDFSARAIETFNRRHMDEYGHIREGELPEIVGVRLATFADAPVPIVTAGLTAPRRLARPGGQRRANLGGGYEATDIFAGAELAPGHEVLGPAIIEERFTTIVVYSGWRALIDDSGDYELTRVGAA
jgi:N-methylhydantoinase A